MPEYLPTCVDVTRGDQSWPLWPYKQASTWHTVCMGRTVRRWTITRLVTRLLEWKVLRVSIYMYMIMLVWHPINRTGSYCSWRTTLAHTYTICVICTRGRASPPSTVRQRTTPLSSLYLSNNYEFPVPSLCTTLQIQDWSANFFIDLNCIQAVERTNKERNKDSW